MKLILPTILLIVAGCATPISQNLVSDIAAGAGASPTDNLIATGLQNAAWNLDQAVRVGALDATDPAPKCFHGVLVQLGLEVPPGTPAPASFTPKVTDFISAGSVLYIRAQQAKKLSGGGVTVPVDCKALIGTFIMDAAAAGKNVLPGGGLLPTFR